MCIHCAPFSLGIHLVYLTSLIGYKWKGSKGAFIVAFVRQQGFHGFIIATRVAMWTYIQIVWSIWMKRNAIGFRLMKNS
jgi:hypothetical protein